MAQQQLERGLNVKEAQGLQDDQGDLPRHEGIHDTDAEEVEEEGDISDLENIIFNNADHPSNNTGFHCEEFYIVFSLASEKKTRPFRQASRSRLQKSVINQTATITHLTQDARMEMLLVPTNDGAYLEPLFIFQAVQGGQSQDITNSDVNFFNALYLKETLDDNRYTVDERRVVYDYFVFLFDNRCHKNYQPHEWGKDFQLRAP